MSHDGGKLGRYEIIREIARSNDIVYEAWDPVLNRRVALKELVIPPSATPAQAEDRIRRFEREARAAGALTHPNIVTIYEVGCDRGRHFLAMEYLEGESLRQRLDGVGALGEAEAIRIISQVLEGLAHAHDKGIVHRDIKPDNIHILPDGRVKITDLGIARLTYEPKLTVTGQIFGTPSYMSPEQVHGEDIDVRSDVWSVGVVLYEAICGAKPFVGSSVIGIAHSVLHDQPPDPPGASYGVTELIRTALSKSPDARFANAGVMLRALQNISRQPFSQPTQKPAGTPYSPSPQQPGANPATPPHQLFSPPQTASQPVGSFSALGWVAAGLLALVVIVMAYDYTNRSPIEPPQSSTSPSSIPDVPRFPDSGKDSSRSNQASSARPNDSTAETATAEESEDSPDRFPETATRIIPRSEAESWTDYDIQYALTEIVIRHGYEPIKAKVREVFIRDRGEHYKPIPGRTLAEAEREMTAIEAINYQTLATVRDERRQQGIWRDPWQDYPEVVSSGDRGSGANPQGSSSNLRSGSRSADVAWRTFDWTVPVGWVESHSTSRHPYHRWQISPGPHVMAFVDIVFGDWGNDVFAETLKQEAKWKATGEPFRRITLESSTFRGLRSAFRIYEKNIGGRWVRRVVHYFFKNGNGYAFGFQAPPEVWDRYDRQFKLIQDSLVLN